MYDLARLAVIFPLFALCHAFTTFETNCTKPQETVNYVLGANIRSTFDILWTCLLTIIACTWSVQHLNIPEQREGRDPGFLGNIQWALKRSWTNTKWMLITVVAPEYLLIKNLGDLSLAKYTSPRLEELAVEDGVPWSLAHTLFADMGGFVIRSWASERMSRSKADPFDTANYFSTYSTPFHLTAFEILRLRDAGLLEHLPYLSEDELNDKSKGDSFVRVVAVAQILWMVTQIVVRGIRHIAISQLEIGVLAFASCAVLIYGVNWWKPKGVQTPMTILQYEGEIPASVIEVIGDAPKQNTFALAFPESAISKRGSRIRNDFSYSPPGYDSYHHVWPVLIGVTIFGGIHLVAWNFQFPSPLEKTLWQWASLLCTFIFVIAFWIVGALSDRTFMPETSYALKRWGFLIIVLIYIVARLYLLVELFRTLYSLSPSVYTATWASSIL
jgi:hypothetical protein